jgi:hypothetical protein
MVPHIGVPANLVDRSERDITRIELKIRFISETTRLNTATVGCGRLAAANAIDAGFRASDQRLLKEDCQSRSWRLDFLHAPKVSSLAS